MPDQPLIRNLKEGESFQGFLLAQEAVYKVSTKGSEYLELKLADASGDLKAFLWDLRAIEGDMEAIRADVFVRVKGAVTSYNGRLQLRLDKASTPSKTRSLARGNAFWRPSKTWKCPAPPISRRSSQ